MHGVRNAREEGRRNQEWNRKIQACVFRARKTRAYRLHIQKQPAKTNTKVLATKERKNLVEQKATHTLLTHTSYTPTGTPRYHTSSTLPRAPECV
ncbi:hypothetical protein BDR03DRAFT_957915 [Suillus americanus]|nr:hypothetical protein BDR03DRAFT_957915 [Suillus americanus]